jgi:phage-related protein
LPYYELHGHEPERQRVKRPLVWRGSSLEDVRRFPQPARREVGRQLNFMQDGRTPADWKSMPTVGHGVLEIRVHASGEHRVLVVVTFGPEIYVLHAFEKKSRATAGRDIQLARRRYRELRREREER